MDISVVIPLYNEAESLPELAAWIARVMAENGFSYEIIFVDDGSTDESWEVVKKLRDADPDHVLGASFRRNYGKSPALNTGFRMASGDVVITPTCRTAPTKYPSFTEWCARKATTSCRAIKRSATTP